MNILDQWKMRVMRDDAQHDSHVRVWRSIEFWMKYPGYECLAGEPRYVTDEIIRRLLLLETEDDSNE